MPEFQLKESVDRNTENAGKVSTSQTERAPPVIAREQIRRKVRDAAESGS